MAVGPGQLDGAMRSLYTGKVEDQRNSAIKESLESWMSQRPLSSMLKARESSTENYDEYLAAMKRAHHDADALFEMPSPRARRRQRNSAEKTAEHGGKGVQCVQIATIASMVPDEIIYNHADYNVRTYEAALMFIDVSGFTELAQVYTQSGRGGPSKLTQVLNSYIGAMVQEILTYKGDVLKFSGDAFLAMWKKSNKLTMQDVVHSAIDCGLTIQKNYGTHVVNDLGITLKVKVAISAGMSHFAIIGSESMSTFIIVGQPVWDVKAAEYLSTAGDVLTSESAWRYVNEAEYCTQPCGDGRHTKMTIRLHKKKKLSSHNKVRLIKFIACAAKHVTDLRARFVFLVLGVGAAWKRVERIDLDSVRAPKTSTSISNQRLQFFHSTRVSSKLAEEEDREDTIVADNVVPEIFREYSLRPSIIKTLKSMWWHALRRFMVTPVLRAIDNEEPLEYLTEVRHVVIVFLNIITETVTGDIMISIVRDAYNHVCRITTESGGLVNKVSMFDKDMMFLVVFGMRGLKHEDEAQKALLCAFALKETLKNPNITSVSIGVTSGRTYCGVVGHTLRREYTVIGSAVNKAARLMIAYPDKVSCDKETFVRSKLDLDYFRLLERKDLKGFRHPGPIYEFNNSGWPERQISMRHPILGRNEELRRYKQVLQNAIDHYEEPFTRYRDLRYGIILLGPRMVGKRRLVEEFLHITPEKLRPIKIMLEKVDANPFSFTRLLMRRLFDGRPSVDGAIMTSSITFKQERDIFETKIMNSLATIPMSPLQMYAVNTIFDLHFPLPDNFEYHGTLVEEQSVKELIRNIFTRDRFSYLRVVSVRDGAHIDNESWRVMMYILHTKCLFFIITIDDTQELSKTAKMCIAKHIFVKMTLQGIDQWYLAALACQLLDVQAIPSDLEKVMESASGGLPGWIQQLVISLVQREDLTVVTVPRGAALEAGAVLPCSDKLHKSELRAESDKEEIQMAVLAENYNFDSMKVDMSVDVLILKTYDALTPFEKMILKCGSVLGDIFSRRMLLHLLQSDSPSKVAKAVAKLFEIRVLQCEGGDFTRDVSPVLVRPAPAPLIFRPHHCSCLGTDTPLNCSDLPTYAFCGYMKFRHPLFRTTTYELLTEDQKLEMHSRALMYLERYTRRCRACGSGCFVRLFGGLAYESDEVKQIRQQIRALNAETRMTSEGVEAAGITVEVEDERLFDSYGNLRPAYQKKTSKNNKLSREKRVRSFSSLELERCECLPILLSVYSQVVDHCKAVGDSDKLFETYMEYVDLSLLNMNIPQAVRLLMEVEENFYQADERRVKEECKISWMKDYRTARILSMRGTSMLMSGDFEEAKRNLLQALNLFGCPFPTSKFKVKISNWKASVKQYISINYDGSRHVRKYNAGWEGQFFDHVGLTYNSLFQLYTDLKEVENAHLAAKIGLAFIRKGNRNFRLLCTSYAHMISIHTQKQQFSKGFKLERLAMDICFRKRGQLDFTEVYAVCNLYTNIFLLYLENGKKIESLQFGLTVLPMMSSLPDVTVSHILVGWMLKLLLSDLRVHEMVLIMREFFYYMTDHCDLSSETWYYYYVVIILLDTGYSVETYRTCEKFYIKKGDAILRSRTPESAWSFFTCMWLVTIRVGAWERSIFWEEKIKQILTLKFQKSEFMISILIRLVEGFLIAYVNEVDNRNLRKILVLEKNIKIVFGYISGACNEVAIYKPRYLLLLAYFSYLQGNRKDAYRQINSALSQAKKFGHKFLQIWIEHTRSHWKGTLNSALVDYWTEHIEIDNLLDYRDFDPDKSVIVPYTLPLPMDIRHV